MEDDVGLGLGRYKGVEDRGRGGDVAGKEGVDQREEGGRWRFEVKGGNFPGRMLG
jgi:hypothetical protein